MKEFQFEFTVALIMIRILKSDKFGIIIGNSKNFNYHRFFDILIVVNAKVMTIKISNIFFKLKC